jgi:hypothetical protein
MPRVGRNSTTPTPRAGPPTQKTNPFDVFMSLRGYSEEWENDSVEISDYYSPPHDSHDDSDGSTVASTMLPLGASPWSGKSQRKKKGTGTRPAPKQISFGGPSKLPKQQQAASEDIFSDKDRNVDLSHNAVMNMYGLCGLYQSYGGTFRKTLFENRLPELGYIQCS